MQFALQQEQVCTTRLLFNHIIVPLLKEVEVNEIRAKIGEYLITRNEELFEELTTLVDIFVTYREETTSSFNITRQNDHLLLQHRMKQFVQILMDRAKKRGKQNLSEVIPFSNREEEICLFTRNIVCFFFVMFFCSALCAGRKIIKTTNSKKFLFFTKIHLCFFFSGFILFCIIHGY